MKLKIKKENLVSPVLKYTRTKSGWGLRANHEEHKLIFSGVFTPQILKSQSVGNETGVIDIYTLFSDSAKQAWKNAYLSARSRKSEVGLEDIFIALLQEKSVKNLLLRLNASTHAAEVLIKNYLTLTHSTTDNSVKIIPFESFLLSVKLHNHKIGSLMLLGALLKSVPNDTILQAIFSNIGLTLDKLELFAVWQLRLNYQFPANSSNFKYLYCCQQTEMLEQHFGYFFDLPAIELAVILSANKTLKDLEHKRALQLLVKAASLAKNKQTKIIGENLVTEASK